MKHAYHNSTAEVERLGEYVLKAETQDGRVLELFESRPYDEFSPSDVHQLAFSSKVPLTSVRRAISNLTRDDKLVKTDSKRPGLYGRDECCWQLATPQRRLF